MVYVTESSQPQESKPKPEEEDIAIDFSNIKKTVKGWFTREEKKQSSPAPEHHPAKEEEEISVEVTKITHWTAKHARWIIPLLLILIALSVSIYLRTMPLHMPIADQWAEETVYNYHRNQIGNRINQQYPNLPPQNREALLESELQKFQEENKEQIKKDIKDVSEEYRNQYRDDQGTLYLLGIDPYHYYRLTRNVLTYGHQGTTIRDGKIIDEFVLAPNGLEATKEFHSYFGAFLHRFLNWFGDFPLMFTFFLVGTIFSALSVIPAFFIGKIIGYLRFQHWLF